MWLYVRSPISEESYISLVDADEMDSCVGDIDYMSQSSVESRSDSCTCR
eukprot:COSAG01_NODE_62016_length_286_cov_2.454545_1_plen_48_part_01